MAPVRPDTDTGRPIPYAHIDPGVRELVRALASYGFTPTDSGDGVSKAAKGWPCLPFLHVFMVTSPSTLASEADRLHALLPDLGEGLVVEASYRPSDGEGLLLLFAPAIYHQ
jgi:hypothetical protein